METNDLIKRAEQLTREFLGEDPASLDEVRNWEASLKRAIRTHNAKKNPAVKMIIEEAQNRIHKANMILLHNRKLTDSEREKVFEQRDFYRKILGWFDEAEKVIKDISHAVDEELA